MSVSNGIDSDRENVAVTTRATTAASRTAQNITAAGAARIADFFTPPSARRLGLILDCALEAPLANPAPAITVTRKRGQQGPHKGLRGEPCQCTQWRRIKATRFCPSTCRCHGIGHEHCPDAKPCIGGCGRKTTASQTSTPGYCPHCAGDARWVKIA